jgi:cysteine desulfurase/selenocysteine lyase
VGALYAKRELLEALPPWQGGGNMIRHVSFEETTYSPPPARFEAGTAILAGAHGLGAAIRYLERIGLDAIHAHEQRLLAYAMDALRTVPGLRLIGTAPDKASVVSFVVDGVDSSRLGELLDAAGIAVRVGHHCAQPTMARFGVAESVQMSLALYSTVGDVDALIVAVHEGARALRHTG